MFLLFCNQEDIFLLGLPPPQGGFYLITQIRGSLHLNRDDRASLAAKAKDGLQQIHEVNELLSWFRLG